MYLHLCSYAGESCIFTVVFASILPDRFWGACYVREYKLNFRNRELLDKRQHFPFREIEASLSQIWLKPDNSGVSL